MTMTTTTPTGADECYSGCILEHLSRKQQKARKLLWSPWSPCGETSTCTVFCSAWDIVRRDLVEGMRQVAYDLDLEMESFFSAVELMDRYFVRTMNSHHRNVYTMTTATSPSDGNEFAVGLIALAALLIGAKLEEIQLVSARDFLTAESASRLNVAAVMSGDVNGLLGAESHVLHTLDYDAFSATSLEFLGHFWCRHRKNRRQESEDDDSILRSARAILSVTLSSPTAIEYMPSTLATAALNLACRRSHQAKKKGRRWNFSFRAMTDDDDGKCCGIRFARSTTVIVSCTNAIDRYFNHVMRRRNDESSTFSSCTSSGRKLESAESESVNSPSPREHAKITLQD